MVAFPSQVFAADDPEDDDDEYDDDDLDDDDDDLDDEGSELWISLLQARTRTHDLRFLLMQNGNSGKRIKDNAMFLFWIMYN